MQVDEAFAEWFCNIPDPGQRVCESYELRHFTGKRSPLYCLTDPCECPYQWMKRVSDEYRVVRKNRGSEDG
jgi:hypothetical protein